MDVFEGITALADYGVRTGLIEEADRTWAVNALLAALELDAYEERLSTKLCLRKRAVPGLCGVPGSV